MRRRLTVALVGLVAGSLVLVGAGALLISRLSAEHNAISQLRQQASVLAASAPQVRQARVLLVVRKLLRLDDARFVVLGAGGVVETPLPPAISSADIDPAALMAGQVVTGSSAGLVFVVQPVELNPAIGLPQAAHVVVLLTRRVGGLLSSWAYLLLVGGITLLVAAAVASWLSERITRPLLSVRDATAKVASGELSARVPIRAREVPELATLAESVNVMAASIEGARERERQLLLSVSHDLRTPLTSICGYAEAIEEGVADPPQHAARVISGEARRLERLVGDLLDLAKLDARRLSLHIEAVPAAVLAVEVVEALGPEASRRGVALVGPALPGAPAAPGRPALPGAGDDPIAAADRDRLAQVLTNLVENAISFARSSVRVSVVSGSVPPGSLGSLPPVVLVVEDDGPGIAPADLPKVFDRFYQANGRGGQVRRGSGLGLAIVAELVAAMGGAVWAESPLSSDGGTRMVGRLDAFTVGRRPDGSPPP